MSNSIKQVVNFRVSPQIVYETLMNSELHSEFTNADARISPDVGGEISAYDGYITGANLELEPGAKIIQSWRADDWPEDYYSKVTFLLFAEAGGTRLEFSHENLPEGTDDEFSKGWIENYWQPLAKFFKE